MYTLQCEIDLDDDRCPSAEHFFPLSPKNRKTPSHGHPHTGTHGCETVVGFISSLLLHICSCQIFCANERISKLTDLYKFVLILLLKMKKKNDQKIEWIMYGDVCVI